MATIIPQSELTKKAVSWISEEIQTSGKTLAQLIEEAGMRFNLSPLDMDFLNRFFEEPSDINTDKGE